MMGTVVIIAYCTFNIFPSLNTTARNNEDVTLKIPYFLLAFMDESKTYDILNDLEILFSNILKGRAQIQMKLCLLLLNTFLGVNENETRTLRVDFNNNENNVPEEDDYDDDYDFKRTCYFDHVPCICE